MGGFVDIKVPSTLDRVDVVLVKKGDRGTQRLTVLRHGYDPRTDRIVIYVEE